MHKLCEPAPTAQHATHQVCPLKLCRTRPEDCGRAMAPRIALYLELQLRFRRAPFYVYGCQPGFLAAHSHATSIALRIRSVGMAFFLTSTVGAHVLDFS